MSERRQSLKINKTFQVRFLLEIVVLTFIMLNLLLTLVVLFGGTDYPTTHPLHLALALGVLEFSALGFLYWYLLKTSHRIAGPIHALQNRLHELGQGDLTVNLAFRKSDHFHATCETFNVSVSELRARIASLKHQARDLSDQAPRGSELEQRIEHLQRELDRFKID